MSDWTDDATQDFKDMEEVFNLCKIPFFAIFGTALGAVREHGFIDFDTDIDLAVVSSIDQIDREIFQDLLSNRDFTVGYRGDENSGVTIARRKILNAIHWLNSEGNCLVVRNPKGGLIVRIFSNLIPGLKAVKFLDGSILVPDPPEAYLVATYGENWRTPTPGKHARPVMLGT